MKYFIALILFFKGALVWLYSLDFNFIILSFFHYFFFTMMSFVLWTIFIIIGVISFIEFSFFGFLFLTFGPSPVNLPIPYLYVQRFRSYFDFITDEFAISQGWSTDGGFFPPFNFGYRQYFFSRIVGWSGTWASFLKRHHRKIRSSVYDWGYRNKIPEDPSIQVIFNRLMPVRAPVIWPWTFKNLTGFSYDNPVWFYSFPRLTVTTYGYQDDFWDDDNYMWYPTYFEELMASISWDLQDKVEYKRYCLNAWHMWVDTWAPSLDPKYLKSNHFYSTSIDSPYSFVDLTQTSLTNSQHINFQKGSFTNFTSKSIYTHVVEQYEINYPLLLKRFGLKPTKNPEPLEVAKMLHFARQMEEDPMYRKINEELLKVKTYSIAYRILKLSPYSNQSGSIPFKYLTYWRFNIYNTFVEFSTVVFDGFFIFPFELKFYNLEVMLGNPEVLGWNFDLFYYVFSSEPWYIILILFGLYLIISVFFVYTLRVFFGKDLFLKMIRDFYYTSNIYIYIYTY